MHNERIVIETKLEPPLVRGKVIRREHLLKILKANLDKKLILICADAGYGKTTLAIQLCQEMARPYVFYNLDASDNDLPVFYAYLVHGIRKLEPGFGEHLLTIARQTRSVEILIGTFVNEFVKQVKKDVYLVLDDYHHLQLNAEITHGLDFLLQHMPGNLHLMVTSRATPPFNLALYLAKQQLLGLEKSHLRFTSEEIQMLLRDIYGLRIPDSEVERVAKHSEGWVTAIQLILQKISLSGESRVKETLNGYVASGEELFDYFAREVFEDQPGKVRGFLIKTAFLETMRPEICNQLLAIRNSRAMFGYLEKNHLFIMRTGGLTYRYHPLFQRFVQDHARRNLAEKAIRADHAKIGRIYMKQHDLTAATDFFLRAAEYAMASSCIKKLFGTMLQNCHFKKLLTWFETFPLHILNRDRGLSIMKAETLIHTMQMDAALGIYTAVERAARRKRDPKNLFRARFGTARVFANTGRFNEALGKLNLCVRSAPKSADLVAVHNLMGVCHIHLADFKQAESSFNEALRISDRLGPQKNNSQLLNNLAIMAFTRGDMAGALKIFKQLAATKGNPLAEPHFHSNVALVLVDMGRLNEAREALKKAYRSSRSINNPRGYLMFLLSLGFYNLERHDFVRAKRCFTHLQDMCGRMGEKLTETRALYGLMKTHYYAGSPDMARRIAEDLVKREGTTLGIRNLDTYLTKALIDIELDRTDEAEAMLLRCLKVVESTDFIYSLMRNRYFLAQLYFKKNNLKKTDDYLRKSLTVARDHGYDYFLVRSARLDRSLLMHAQARAIVPGYADSILGRLLKETRIDIKFLGELEVAIDGAPIDPAAWQTKKAQIVFAYLIANRKRAVTKEELMTRFSEQSEPGLADQVIRTTVSRIQKALGLHGFINYRQGIYHINQPVSLTIDSDKFEAMIRAVIKHGRPLEKDMLAMADSAFAIYRGDFLTPFYDDWCEERRRYFRDLYLTGLQIVGDDFLAAKQPRRALDYFQKIAGLDPVNEVAIEGIVKSYTALGEKRRARDAYKTYKTKVKDSLKASPDENKVGLPET